jgi:hypothetical protein
MSHFLQHAHFFNQPVWLTDKQQQDPMQVLTRFTEDYTLSELRTHLSEMGDACLTTDNPHFDDPESRANLLLLHVKLEMLLEGVYLLVKRHTQDT